MVLSSVGGESAFQQNRGPTHRDHHHSALPKDFVVEVNPDDGVGVHQAGPLRHLFKGVVSGRHQGVFIGLGSPTDDIRDARQDVAKDVGPIIVSPVTNPR